MPEREPSAFTTMPVRVVTAVLMGAVILAAILFGGTYGLAVALAFVAAFAAAEFYRIARHEHRKPNELFGVVAAACMPIAAAYSPRAGLLPVVTALVVAAIVWHVLFKQVTTADTAITVFGAVYTGFTLAHLVLLQSLPYGTVLVVVTFVSVWANDVFAYLIGAGIGRIRLAPAISPHKSWEGFAGGALFSLLVWLAASAVVRTGLTLPWLAAIGIAVPVAATLGDLAESRFKREAVVKDSGVSLPGHGGFLDRFDSMIVAGVVVYYLVLAARSL